MSNKLEELRAKMRERQASQTTETNTDRSSYPFWNIPEDAEATVRFLPDSNNSNDFFWVEQSHISLPFAGMLGREQKPFNVNVPCMQMYGEKCPIIEETKPLWKTDVDLARKYYRKKTMIFHGFVRKDPIAYAEGAEKPENPIRRFKIGTQLFKKIEAGLMDPEMEFIPCDLVNGTDFRIIKTKSGQYFDYNTSNWSRRSSSLTEQEAVAVEKYGIPDMTTYLPSKPDQKTLELIMDMFVDSMNGLPYDLEKYGHYYKPYGADDSEGSSNSTTAMVKQKFNKPEPTVSASNSQNDDEPPFDVDAKPVTPKKVDVQELLAKIQKNKK